MLNGTQAVHSHFVQHRLCLGYMQTKSINFIKIEIVRRIMGNKRHAKAWCIAEVDYHADERV